MAGHSAWTGTLVHALPAQFNIIMITPLSLEFRGMRHMHPHFASTNGEGSRYFSLDCPEPRECQCLSPPVLPSRVWREKPAASAPYALLRRQNEFRSRQHMRMDVDPQSTYCADPVPKLMSVACQWIATVIRRECRTGIAAARCPQLFQRGSEQGVIMPAACNENTPSGCA